MDRTRVDDLCAAALLGSPSCQPHGIGVRRGINSGVKAGPVTLGYPGKVVISSGTCGTWCSMLGLPDPHRSQHQGL